VSVLCSSVPPEQLALTILRHPVPSSNMLVCAWNLHCEPYASCRNWHLYSNVFVRSTKYWSTWVVVTGRFLFSLLFSWLKRYYFPKFGMTVKLVGDGKSGFFGRSEKTQGEKTSKPKEKTQNSSLKAKAQKVGTFLKTFWRFCEKLQVLCEKHEKICQNSRKNSKLKEKTQNSRWKLEKSALLGSLGAGKA